MTVGKISLSAVLLLISAILVACGSSVKSINRMATIQKNKTLIVALSPDYAPFEFKTLVDGKVTIVGADIELAKAIGDKLGVAVKLSPMSFNNVLGSLSSGKADIAISGISPTAERAEVFDFSDVYYEANNIILVQKSKLSFFTVANHFKGKSVAAQKGSVQEGVAQEQLKGSRLISLNQTPEMIGQLKAGKLDGVVMEEAIAKGYLENNPDLAIVDIGLTASEELGSAVAIPKGNLELKATVNEAIQELKNSGQMEKFVQEAYELSLDGE